MLFTKLISIAAVLGTALSSAIPNPAPEAELQGFETGTAIKGQAGKKRYRLKTKLLEGDATKDNLYIQTYHTGAGLNDAVLTPTFTSGTVGYLNATEGNWIFELNGATFPSGFNFAYEQYYTRWLGMHIDAGYGEPGFFKNGSGLVTSYAAWTGWLVCDWWHVSPQLFWSYYFTDFPIPSSCARVELHPVLVV